MKKAFLFSLIFFHGLLLQEFSGYAQNSLSSKSDSLITLLKTAGKDSSRAIILNALAFEYAFSSTDSALYFAEEALNLASRNENATDEAERIRFVSIKGASFHNLGVIYYYSSDFDKCFENYYKALEIREKLVKEKPHVLQFKNELADSWNNLGIAYKNSGNYPKALESYQKVIFIHEAIIRLNRNFISLSGLGAAYNNLGLMYQTNGNLSDALQSHLKSLKIKEEIGDKPGIAYSYNNLGIVYNSQGNNDLALEYYKKSLEVRNELDDKLGMAVSYNNMGNLFSDLGRYKEALEHLLLSLKLKEEADDKKGIANSYSNIGTLYYEIGDQQKNRDSAAAYYKNSLYYLNEVMKMDSANNDRNGLASSYLNIGIVYTKQGKYNEAEQFLLNGLDFSNEAGDKDYIKNAYLGLSELYARWGNYQRAYDFHLRFGEVKDSLFSEESNRQITEMSALYETEKKENQILLLEKNKEKQEAENIRQRLFLMLAGAIVLLLTILAIIIFRTLKLTRKQKKIIEVQKSEVEKQKKIIEEKNSDITDSINYAKGIQQAMLPARSSISEAFPQSFIYFKPKDIVSGDFYFFQKKGEQIFIAAADCTGHGVPGALMSMIGSEKLEEAVTSANDLSDVLGRLNAGIKASLKQTGKEGATRDGMDIALCAFDKKKRSLIFAGANRPLWIIRNNNNTIEEIPPTKKAIGGFTDDQQQFPSLEVSLSEGDTFYIFSDGFADCFSGKIGKKFTTKRFRELLLNMQSLSMEEQGRHLEKVNEEWRSGAEQVDDILVIGVRFY